MPVPNGELDLAAGFSRQRWFGECGPGSKASIVWKSGDLCVFQPSAGVSLDSFHARSSCFSLASLGFVNLEPFAALFISLTHPTSVASSPIKCAIPTIKPRLEETQFA